jgi:DNA-binding transcriptional ArsR family regulator
MDRVFKALADQTRRELLDRLYEKSGQTLGELYAAYSETMSRQAVMKHLSILEDANLVATVWNGREKRHYLNPVPIHAIQDRWIKKFEQPRIDALSALKSALEGTQEKGK